MQTYHGNHYIYATVHRYLPKITRYNVMYCDMIVMINKVLLLRFIQENCGLGMCVFIGSLKNSGKLQNHDKRLKPLSHPGIPEDGVCHLKSQGSSFINSERVSHHQRALV